MDNRPIQWVTGRDAGLSSNAIVAFMSGVRPDRGYDCPRDPSDLGRCLRLLDFIPEYKERMIEMREVSPEWRNLIDHWEEISALYYQEEPSGKAPKCYDRMTELIYGIKESR